MNSIVFDKRELAAPAEPVGWPAEALSFNTPATATAGRPLEAVIQAETVYLICMAFCCRRIYSLPRKAAVVRLLEQPTAQY